MQNFRESTAREPVHGGPMRAAVTGATGFTGGALVRALLTRGWHVRALARNRTGLDDCPGLDVVEGDLTDRPALEALVADADVVFHVAAMFRSEGPLDRFMEVNYRGTTNMLEAARAAGVRRFVHCSTIGVHGNVDGGPADEQSPFAPRDHYQTSKLKAEEACREAIARGGMEIVVVRPCSIYGPGDLRMLKLFRMLAGGYFYMIGDGRPNFHPVYIDDLVEGFLLAGTHPGAAGETFIVGGPSYLPLDDYVAAAAQAVGARPPRLRIPYALMETAAAACETVCRPLRIEPVLHRRRLSFFRHNRAFDCGKAARVLGYRPRVDVAEGFERTVDWYRSEGLLPPARRSA